MALFVYKPGLVENDLVHFLCFVLFPCLIIILESSAVKKCFCHSFWGTWGQISFNVYVWHVVGYLLLDIIFYHIGYAPDLTNPLYMYAYLFVIELFGTFSFFFIEKPLNRFLDGIVADFNARRAVNASESK